MPRHESLWIATTDERAFGALETAIDVDVAVLGAGIAGLTAAVLLKDAGLRVVVIEAALVCSATTGHTTAKVSAQHGLIYETLSSTVGQEGARAYAEANLAAIDLVETLVRRHGINCDWERRPAYVYTEQDSGVHRIEKEVEAAQKAGLPASYTEETDLPWSVKAAVRFEDQAQFIPGATASRWPGSWTATEAACSSARARTTSRTARPAWSRPSGMRSGPHP